MHISQLQAKQAPAIQRGSTADNRQAGGRAGAHPPTWVSHPLLPDLLDQLLSVALAEVLVADLAAVLEQLGHLRALHSDTAS